MTPKIINLNINKIIISKEYKELVPRPSKDDYNSLLEDIKKNGIQQPLIINSNNILLDGYTRIDIVKTLKIKEVPCFIKTFENKLEEQHFVISVNKNRRHLNIAQKAELALLLLPLEKELAKKRQELTMLVGRGKQIKNMVPQNFAEPFLNGESIEIVSDKVGISKETLRKAIKIKEVAKTEPAIATAWNETLAGQKTIHSTYFLVKRHLHQQELKFKSKNFNNNNSIQIIYADSKKYLKNIDNESIDLIFTDPIYNDLESWRILAKEGKRVLKPGKFLLSYASQFNLPEVLNILSEHLKYLWTISIKNYAPSRLLGARNVISEWTPLVIYFKPSYKKQELFHDFITRTNKNNTKELHDYSKPTSETREIIKTFSSPGDLLLDPFAGSGGIVLGAVQESRKTIAIDNNKNNIAVIKGRINTFLNQK